MWPQSSLTEKVCFKLLSLTYYAIEPFSAHPNFLSKVLFLLLKNCKTYCKRQVIIKHVLEFLDLLFFITMHFHPQKVMEFNESNSLKLWEMKFKKWSENTSEKIDFNETLKSWSIHQSLEKTVDKTLICQVVMITSLKIGEKIVRLTLTESFGRSMKCKKRVDVLVVILPKKFNFIIARRGP